MANLTSSLGEFLVRPIGIIVTASAIVFINILAVVIYRLTLHPLAKYPGPFLAKITSWYPTYFAVTGSMHLDIQRCHDKYGKFVRYGPNRLLVNSAEGFEAIYGPRRNVKKADGYRAFVEGSIIGTRDNKYHAWQRAFLAQGFTDSAMRVHEPKVLEVIDIFIDKVTGSDVLSTSAKGLSWGSAKNMSEWCNHLTTDVVAKVVFSSSWNLLTSAKNRAVSEVLWKITQRNGVLLQNPALLWGKQIIAYILMPWNIGTVPAILDYSRQLVTASLSEHKKQPQTDDVFGRMMIPKTVDVEDLTNTDGRGLVLPQQHVIINGALLIIAGADTTSTTLAAAFFYLSRNPDAYAKVAEEVRATYTNPSEIRNDATLRGLTNLRASIDETLRLTNAAAQPLWREVMEGGIVMDGEQVPAGVDIGVGLYSLHRNSVAFPDPQTYNIDRWLGQSDETLKTMGRYFQPFSAGPRMCVARNFALMELWMVMAHVFLRLDFKKGDGPLTHLGEGAIGGGMGRENPSEFQMQTGFTTLVRGPVIQFAKRTNLVI